MNGCCDDLLAEELAAVRGELARVDGKSSTLLALAAGGLAVAATTHPHSVLGAWLIRAAMFTTAVALVLVLFVVRPRLGRTGFFQHARRSAADTRTELAESDLHAWRSRELLVLSRIAVRKYELLRAAVTLQIIALVLVLVEGLTLML
jgi:Pycsar effector protein